MQVVQQSLASTDGGPVRKANLAKWPFFGRRLVPAFANLNVLLRAFALSASPGCLVAAEGVLHMVRGADMSLEALRDDPEVRQQVLWSEQGGPL